MKTEQVLEIIQQNGIGKDIRCFFSSTDVGKEEDHMSIINNYKYNKGILKLYLDRLYLNEHIKILTKYPDCELLIKKDIDGEQSITIRALCKFLKIDNQYIYARIFKLKYPDDSGKETSQMLRV